MMRTAVARTGASQRAPCASLACSLRAVSVAATRHYAAAPAGKKKVKVGFVKSTREKIKKSGVTHLKFRDAVKNLRYEKLASDLKDEHLGELSAAQLAASASQIVTYSADTEKTLSTLDTFKRYQHHELFARPVSMVTESTQRLHSTFVQKLDGASRSNRICMVGEKGMGKSTLVAQAQALALSQHRGDVVLLHLAHPERIVEGSSDYVFNAKLGKYQQPMFTKRWIMKLREANEAVFKKMLLTEDSTFTAKKTTHRLKKNEHTVHDFLVHNHGFGVFGSTDAFQFFVRQLQAHAAQFPVLFSVDNFNALVAEPYTKYFHPDMRPVSFDEFEVGHFVAQLVSGDVSFSRGGVLLAESKDFGDCKTLRVGLQLQQPDPYDKKHQCDLAFAAKMAQHGGVQAFPVGRLTKDQARDLMRFWASVGVLQVRDYPTREAYDDAEHGVRVGEFGACKDPERQLERLVQSSYTVSGGNPGSLLKVSNRVF